MMSFKGGYVTFPTVRGSNLLRQQLTLPQDFQGSLNLLFIAFEQWHQMEVDSWLPLVKELEQQVSGLYYYELPTIQSRSSLSKWFINEGMRAGIPNPKTRERTITLYLDKKNFRKVLELTNEEHIYILVVDPQGKVLFRLQGQYTQEGATSLRQALIRLSESWESNSDQTDL
jgi:hypothetical protein